MSSRGYNAGRQIMGGSGQSDVTQLTRDSIQSGSPPVIQRAVVVDVISNPSFLTNAQLTDLERKVSNPQLVEGMPSNSILARVTTNGQDRGHPAIQIFYPLFSTHMQMPIKAGEQVLIMYEDYSGTGGSVGYWVTRPVAARQIEDVNYTHGDRIFNPYNHPRHIPSNVRLQAMAPLFPNGAGTSETLTLQPSGSTNPYDDIVNHASASKITTFEPVPRLTKRPGDFLFQGSNNSAIFLGQDRTGPLNRAAATTDVVSGSGAIDIVVGLGAPRTMPASHTADPGATNPTSPRVITNKRNNKEVYKTPYQSQKSDNPNEGNPDFVRDLARLYLAMKTQGDLNFGVQLGTIYPNPPIQFVAPVNDLATGNQAGQSFAILKSEQVRLIAKGKDVPNGFPESGEIRLIKEGAAGDGLSLLLMTKEGNIILSGKNIQVLPSTPGTILLGCKSSSAADSDPVVLYSKLKSTLDIITDNINSLCTTMANQLTSLNSALTSATLNSGAPFYPVPGLVALNTALVAAATALTNFSTTSLQPLQSTDRDTAAIASTKSKWVFVNKDNQG